MSEAPWPTTHQRDTIEGASFPVPNLRAHIMSLLSNLLFLNHEYISLIVLTIVCYLTLTRSEIQEINNNLIF